MNNKITRKINFKDFEYNIDYKKKLKPILEDVKNHKDSIFNNFIWITKDKKEIPYKNLSINHINNIIRLFGDKEISFRKESLPISCKEAEGGFLLNTN